MDCLEGMKILPDECLDMILTDPPYSSGGLFAGDRKTDTRTKYTDKDYNGAARFQNFSGDNMDQRSFTEFMRMVFSMARTKAKPEAIISRKRARMSRSGMTTPLSTAWRSWSLIKAILPVPLWLKSKTMERPLTP